MARITVEDCLKHLDNRFNLVLLAARRARILSNSRTKSDVLANSIAEKILKTAGTYRCPPYPLVEAGTDKPTVIALREIAAGLVTKDCVEKEEKDIDLNRSREVALSQRYPTDNPYNDDFN